MGETSKFLSTISIIIFLLVFFYLIFVSILLKNEDLKRLLEVSTALLGLTITNALLIKYHNTRFRHEISIFIFLLLYFISF